MGKQYCFRSIFRLLLTLLFPVIFVDVSGQTGKEQDIPIPDSINNVFLISCMPCHGSKGGRLPGTRLNFSRWKGYSTGKKIEKASLICAAVRKGSMPPGSVKESKPELLPTKVQIDLICKWAESLREHKKDKK